MTRIAPILAAARALLEMNIKPIAAALQVSDRFLTQVEKDADPVDPRVQRLVAFYEDLGVRFHRTGGEIDGVFPADVRKLTFTFAGDQQPFKRLGELQHALRHIRGVAVNTWLLDKSTAAPKDTIDIHFPVDTRPMVADLLEKWTDDGGGFAMLGSDGAIVPVSKGDIRPIVMGPADK